MAVAGAAISAAGGSTGRFVLLGVPRIAVDVVVASAAGVLRGFAAASAAAGAGCATTPLPRDFAARTGAALAAAAGVADPTVGVGGTVVRRFVTFVADSTGLGAAAEPFSRRVVAGAAVASLDATLRRGLGSGDSAA